MTATLCKPQALVGDSVENVGYVIPCPVIEHFLIDYQRTGAAGAAQELAQLLSLPR